MVSFLTKKYQVGYSLDNLEMENIVIYSNNLEYIYDYWVYLGNEPLVIL
jgi:hypothetical protein